MGGYYDLNITLGYQSREALKKLNDTTKLGNYLKFFLGAGASFDAVFSTNAVEKTIQAVGKIQCRVIKNIAIERIIQTHSNERKFWERINDSSTS